MVQMHVQTGDDHIMLMVIFSRETVGQTTGRMVIDISDCGNASSCRVGHFLTARELSQDIPERFGPAGIIIPRHVGIDGFQQAVIDREGNTLHKCSIRHTVRAMRPVIW